ncbi:hypothetical protein [Methylobacterium sp. AMS5]|uniref:hypothetical protein n=1 Tax=Methylobacterium sp. AMS5 TaxID=925818 RepID=UPI0011877341|nr:hypothetical protein [Methylobacterium sp. AMS5]
MPKTAPIRSDQLVKNDITSVDELVQANRNYYAAWKAKWSAQKNHGKVESASDASPPLNFSKKES